MSPQRAPLAALTLALLGACAQPTPAAAPAAPGAPAATTARAAQALTASGAWIRAIPGSDVAAAYLSLHNSGLNPVVITGVRSPRAGHAMFHESATVAGQARMRPLESLRIAAGATLTLAPGGLHVMLGMLGAPLTAGEDVPLELLLGDGTALTVTARVRAPGAE